MVIYDGYRIYFFFFRFVIFKNIYDGAILGATLGNKGHDNAQRLYLLYDKKKKLFVRTGNHLHSHRHQRITYFEYGWGYTSRCGTLSSIY